MFHVEHLHGLQVDVPRETAEKLEAFVELLLRWNRRINLISARSAEEVWRRHVVDSLQLLPLLPAEPTPVLDLGSGAGFPGLVLAIGTPRKCILVEADKRKAAFLADASARLGLANVEVRATRIEDGAALPKTRALTARALAPLSTLLGHAHSLLSPGGVALFPKGRGAEGELTEARRDWMMRVERFPSRTDPASTIFRISEVRPAGPEA